MELGERLRTARQNAKLTQASVAKNFGISRVSVTQWEGGITRPDPDKFATLADLYGVPLEWLIDGRGKGPSTHNAPMAGEAPAKPKRFLRTSSFKFYVQDWRKFMGVKVADAAKAAGLPTDEYQAHETYPINFTLGQVAELADLFGIRGDQLWFPPPVKKSHPPQIILSSKPKRKLWAARK